jgi:hypothetical protein
MDTPAFSLAEIKKAISKHNKEVNNDIKVRITPDGLKFSSVKAEEIAIKNEEEKTGLKKQALQNMLIRDTYEAPKEKPKKTTKKKLDMDTGQPSILDKFAMAKNKK